MILDRADDVLKLALAAAALSLGGGAGYYYGVFLPGQARTEQSRAEAAQERADALLYEKANQEAKAQARKREAVEKAQASYATCRADAYSNYHARWQKTCTRLHKDDMKELDECVARGFDEAVCRSRIQVTPAQNCSLENELGDDYDEGLERDRLQCLEELKARTAAVDASPQ